MKKIVSLSLIITMLLSSSILFASNKFSDVNPNHWAVPYIYEARYYNIINGYPDGTFKPENKVKTGEFIKMVVSCRWKPDLSKELPVGTHWVTPYAKLANNFLIYEPSYTYEKYETYITRAEAVKLIWKMYKIIHPDVKIDKTEQYIKNCPDQNLIEDAETRRYFNACIQYGLISGFEDGTLRPNETLTRAQAAKLLCLVKK